MNGKTAALTLAGIGILLAALLVTSTISSFLAGVGFAIALLALGVASRGFRRP